MLVVYMLDNMLVVNIVDDMVGDVCVGYICWLYMLVIYVGHILGDILCWYTI